MTRLWSTHIWLTVTVAMCGAAASAEEADISEDVETVLASFQDKYGFPGATAAYVMPDGSSGSVAVGLADAESETPMTSDSRMLAASIGKTFVSALALSLENEGALSRRDSLSDHLGDAPWFSRLPNAEGITVGHLLRHTSGLPDHVYMDGFAAQIMHLGNKGSFGPEDAISFVLGAEPLFEPGSAWSYTDTGYLLLGLVIESATGRDFYDLVEERFLTPLKLSQTSPSTTRVLSGLAVGYTAEDNAFGLPVRTMGSDGEMLWDPSVEWTGGGFVSTSQDLARWGRALFTGTAMDEPYLDRLLDAVPVDPNSAGVLYGNGVAVYASTRFGLVHGHGGLIPGYVSSLRHYADHGITVAFQINSDVGVADNSTEVLPALEAALATLLIEGSIAD